MNRRATIRSVAAAVLLALVLAACGPGGMTEADADDIRNQLQDIHVRLDAIENTVEQHASEAENGEELVAEVQQELDTARTVLAQVDERLAPPPPPPADDFGADPMAPGGF